MGGGRVVCKELIKVKFISWQETVFLGRIPWSTDDDDTWWVCSRFAPVFFAAALKFRFSMLQGKEEEEETAAADDQLSRCCGGVLFYFSWFEFLVLF